MTGYEKAAQLLPGTLRTKAFALPAEIRGAAQEFRLRLGQRPAVTIPRGDHPLDPDRRVSAEDLLRVVEIAARASPYAVEAGVRQGFITAPGGVRVGLCGRIRPGTESAWASGGITSAAIRIPRAAAGCANGFCSLPFSSTLIVSPPGAGKTTLLRDMVRQLSGRGLRVGLCDERGEVAALGESGFGFDVGPRTDVLSDCPKDAAAFQLLRTMNPQVIAMDEITSQRDVEVCLAAAGCGVSLLATAHAGSPDELHRSSLYRALARDRIFRRVIGIRLTPSGREYVEVTP